MKSLQLYNTRADAIFQWRIVGKNVKKRGKTRCVTLGVRDVTKKPPVPRRNRRRDSGSEMTAKGSVAEEGVDGFALLHEVGGGLFGETEGIGDGLERFRVVHEVAFEELLSKASRNSSRQATWRCWLRHIHIP